MRISVLCSKQLCSTQAQVYLIVIKLRKCLSFITSLPLPRQD